MTITEFVIFKSKDGATWSDILPIFREGALAQSNVSGYKVHVFDDVDTPGIFYLLSGWESVAAHEAWIGHEANKKAMSGLAPFMDVERLLHSTINPDSAWDNVRELYFTEAPGEPAQVAEVAGHRPIWLATGIDAEGKTTESHRFVGFAQLFEDEARFEWTAGTRRMRRHDIV